jgi:hypothetical protein
MLILFQFSASYLEDWFTKSFIEKLGRGSRSVLSALTTAGRIYFDAGDDTRGQCRRFLAVD